MKLKLEAITHFSKDDVDCGGDYYDIDLQTENGKIIASWDDYYHDHGDEKLEGFIQGLKWALDNYVELAFRPQVELEYKDVADREI